MALDPGIDVQDPGASQGRPPIGQEINITPEIMQGMLARAKAYAARGDWANALKALPAEYTVDPQTHQIRDKTWWEKHGDLTMFMIQAAASFAGGYYASGTNAATGATGAAGAGGSSPSALDAAWSGTGPTTAGSMAATESALAGGTVPAALGGAGVMPAVAGGAAATTSTLSSYLWKYLPPTIAGAIDDILQQNNHDANRAQQLQIAQQAVGYDQSKQDPLRAQMHQADDVGRLERMGTPPPNYTSTGPYAKYMGPDRTPQLSTTYKNTIANAQGQIARGEHPMPNMVDPANWGNSNVQDLTGAAPPGTVGSAPPSTLSPARLLTGGPAARTRLGDPSNPPPYVPPGVSNNPLVPQTPPTPPVDPTAPPADPYQGLSLASLVARYGPRRGLEASNA